jgi:hypothetical protein
MPDTQERVSVKEAVIEMIRRLPDDCTFEDIQYHLFVRQKVEGAMHSLGDGKGVSQDEAERRSLAWRKSSGGNPA